MGVYVDCTIKILKGDPKTVIDVVRTKDRVLDLAAIATGKHHRFPQYAIYGEEEAEYLTEGNTTIIKFFVKNWTPNAIFDELAERFPEHEFIVVREFEQTGHDELLLKNGKCRLIRSQRWEWRKNLPELVAIRDIRWDWDGVKQEGSFDITKQFLEEEYGNLAEPAVEDEYLEQCIRGGEQAMAEE